ncbi:aldo/keto reductase [Frankia sp. CNm7]|uniref:Aldo/keto reductase n=1 Tax=Frankia nepalensis TaxID=1836974 RepID=A0A937RCE7_9ACTN|nr:aldo/keto reductase [Frankia nepalensis]MBL7497683.1 aldo/keto reductase [Frankia nepalensis]MBL7514730.1 aldo/keto reductase [Frankia nepalensis]MBL7522369.1 aldo/keto reductase [Frankia nepalensis]MBL7626329.1 aldo/keto reductase [Frankia nepalensis]
MRYRPLGSSGLLVSVVGLGCNNFGSRVDLNGTRAVVDAAIEAGINFFDTADTYGNKGGSETLLGHVLRSRRDDVVLATKFGNDMGGVYGPDYGARASRRYIRKAVEGSLSRLQTDYLDLYQLHNLDGVTPIEETLDALDELVKEGKVRYVGACNLDGWQAADAEWTARASGRTRFISAQNHYNLLERGVEAELVPAALKYGIGILPYFPLANGILTGKYSRDEPPEPGTRMAGRQDELTDEIFDQVETLETFARERDRSLLDVAIGGLAAQPGVASVIAGATSAAQVRANAVAGAWQPRADDLAVLDKIAPTYRPRA